MATTQQQQSLTQSLEDLDWVFFEPAAVRGFGLGIFPAGGGPGSAGGCPGDLDWGFSQPAAVGDRRPSRVRSKFVWDFSDNQQILYTVTAVRGRPAGVRGFGLGIFLAGGGIIHFSILFINVDAVVSAWHLFDS